VTNYSPYRDYAFIMDNDSAETYVSKELRSEICCDVLDYISSFAKTKANILPKMYANLKDIAKANENPDRGAVFPGYVDFFFEDGSKIIGDESKYAGEIEALMFMAGALALQTGKKVMIITKHQQYIKDNLAMLVAEVVFKNIKGLKSLSCLPVDLDTAKNILVSADDDFAKQLAWGY
jgi:hypothetical protein